jgi:hypothetical protein
MEGCRDGVRAASFWASFLFVLGHVGAIEWEKRMYDLRFGRLEMGDGFFNSRRRPVVQRFLGFRQRMTNRSIPNKKTRE